MLSPESPLNNNLPVSCLIFLPTTMREEPKVFSFDGYLTGSVCSTLRSVVILRQCWKGFVV